jgi:hypothetical protein
MLIWLQIGDFCTLGVVVIEKVVGIVIIEATMLVLLPPATVLVCNGTREGSGAGGCGYANLYIDGGRLGRTYVCNVML